MRLLRRASVLLVILALVELTLRVTNIPSYLLPLPSSIVTWLTDNSKIWSRDFASTAVEAISGLAIAAVSCMSLFRLGGGSAKFVGGVVRASTALQTVPVLALAPLLALWFGNAYGSKIAASALIAGPVIFSAVFRSANEMPDDERAFAKRVFYENGSYVSKFLIPHALPTLFASLKIASPLAVIGAIVGEFVGASSGLGFRILSGSYYLRTAEMLSGVILAVVLGLILTGAVGFVEGRLLGWANKRTY
jgi:NitT/TauT family transport system permease protein